MGLYLASDACLGDIDYRSKVEKQFKDKPFIMGIIGKIIGGIIAFIILTSIISSCSGSCSCSGGCCSCGDDGYSYYNRKVTASGTVYVDVYCNGSKLESKTVRFTEYDDGSKYASYSDSNTSNLKINKEYYVFKGIFKNLDKTDQIIDSYGYYSGGFNSGDTYYAILDPQDEGVEYTINYYSSKPNETAKFVSAEKINVGNSFMLPAGGIDEFDGLDFVGGFMGSANGTMIINEEENIVNGYEDFYLNKFTSANTTEKSLNVILVYETKKSKVTFINEDFNINKMVKIEYGSTLAEAFAAGLLEIFADGKLNLEKYDVTGIGYYAHIPATDADLLNKIYDDELNLYLFIKEKKTLTLIPFIDGKEVTESITTETVYLDDNKILSAPTEQPGYRFIGWYRDKQFSGTAVNSITITGDTTLYGKFDVATYTIKYCYGDIRPSGYSENQQFDSTTYSYNKNDAFGLKSLNEVSAVKGYSVVGWSLNQDGRDPIGTSLPAGSYGDKILYPSYDAAKFTVYINSKPGTSLPSYSYEITYNKAFRITPPTVTDSTIEFIGYQTDKGVLITDENGNSKFAFNETYLGCTYDELTDLLLDIKTDTKKYTVKFMDGSTTVDTKKVEAGQAVSETTEVLSQRAGMTFSHWSLTQDGQAYNFTNTVNSDLTLYAVFKYNTYKVYLYDTDKTTLLKTIDVTYNSSWSIDVQANGGWKTLDGKNVATNAGTVIGSYSPYLIEGNLSIYKTA